MRWQVEVSTIGKDGFDPYTVEADSWQRALQAARKLRGDESPMSGFSIELLTDGCRAVDPAARIRYEVKRAKDDAPLSPGAEAVAPAARKAPRPAESKSAVPAAKPAAPAAPAQAPAQAPAAPAAPVAASKPKTPNDPWPAAEVLSKREEDPTDSVPLTYREYAFLVPKGTNEDAAAQALLVQFLRVRKALEDKKPGKLVNLAAFDEKFSGRPTVPPIATLTWKDWRGEPVVAFPRRDGKKEDVPTVVAPAPAAATDGQQRAPNPKSTTLGLQPVQAPPQAPQPAPPQQAPVQVVVQVPPAPAPAPVAAAATATAVEQAVMRGDTVQMPQSPQLQQQIQQALAQQAAQQQQQQQAPVQPSFPQPAPIQPAPVHAAPPIQPAPIQPVAPVQVAAAPAPVQVPVSAPPQPMRFEAPEPSASMQPVSAPPAPSSAPRVRGDELIADLFESMHELHFQRDAVDAGDFILGLAMTKIPSKAGIVHFYDIDKREFVVGCLAGSAPPKLLTRRHPEAEALLNSAMRKRGPIVTPGADSRVESAARFALIGDVLTVATAPVMQAGRFLGAIELVDPADGSFDPSDVNALRYIADQFAEYLGQHGIVVDPERISKRTPAS